MGQVSPPSIAIPVLRFIINSLLLLADFRGRIFDKLICIILYEQCMEHCVAKVVHCNERPTSKIRPVPLNLIALQKLASIWFRLSGEETLSIAQRLYTEGILSYPRTETTFFAEDIELQGLLNLHRDHDSWGGYTRRLLDDGGFVWPLHGGMRPHYTTKLIVTCSRDNKFTASTRRSLS